MTSAEPSTIFRRKLVRITLIDADAIDSSGDDDNSHRRIMRNTLPTLVFTPPNPNPFFTEQKIKSPTLCLSYTYP
ncbi:hypothetical protein LguiA_011537 [Lonicera macranthoides]